MTNTATPRRPMNVRIEVERYGAKVTAEDARV